jgi:hypothetical protein
MIYKKINQHLLTLYNEDNQSFTDIPKEKHFKKYKKIVADTYIVLNDIHR